MTKNKKFRSSEWYNSKSHRRDTFVHRGWMRNQGHPNHLFDGRPVIGICNTWSELTPCNGHFREIAESVRRGVYEACLLYTSPSPRDRTRSRMPSSA